MLSKRVPLEEDNTKTMVPFGAHMAVIRWCYTVRNLSNADRLVFTSEDIQHLIDLQVHFTHFDSAGPLLSILKQQDEKAGVPNFIVNEVHLKAYVLSHPDQGLWQENTPVGSLCIGFILDSSINSSIRKQDVGLWVNAPFARFLRELVFNQKKICDLFETAGTPDVELKYQFVLSSLMNQSVTSQNLATVFAALTRFSVDAVSLVLSKLTLGLPLQLILYLLSKLQPLEPEYLLQVLCHIRVEAPMKLEMLDIIALNSLDPLAPIKRAWDLIDVKLLEKVQFIDPLIQAIVRTIKTNKLTGGELQDKWCPLERSQLMLQFIRDNYSAIPDPEETAKELAKTLTTLSFEKLMTVLLKEERESFKILRMISWVFHPVVNLTLNSQEDLNLLVKLTQIPELKFVRNVKVKLSMVCDLGLYLGQPSALPIWRRIFYMKQFKDDRWRQTTFRLQCTTSERELTSNVISIHAIPLPKHIRKTLCCKPNSWTPREETADNITFQLDNGVSEYIVRQNLEAFWHTLPVEVDETIDGVTQPRAQNAIYRKYLANVAELEATSLSEFTREPLDVYRNRALVAGRYIRCLIIYWFKAAGWKRKSISKWISLDPKYDRMRDELMSEENFVLPPDGPPCYWPLPAHICVHQNLPSALVFLGDDPMDINYTQQELESWIPPSIRNAFKELFQKAWQTYQNFVGPEKERYKKLFAVAAIIGQSFTMLLHQALEGAKPHPSFPSAYIYDIQDVVDALSPISMSLQKLVLRKDDKFLNSVDHIFYGFLIGLAVRTKNTITGEGEREIYIYI